MEADVTPDMSEQEDNNAEVNPPRGDLADLACNVGMQPVPLVATPAGDSNGGACAKTKKNKGVGKGCSGLSGPPPPRRKCISNLVQLPINAESDEEQDIEVDELVEPGSTQHIMVGIRRGYSVYPGYLFDVPQKRIRIDHLHKQFMIHEIARARAEHRFYRHGMTFMSTIKGFLRMFATQNNMPFPGNSNAGDHVYAMSKNDSYEASEDEGSDVDIEGKQ